MNVDFSEILLEVVRRKASDLHITAGAPPMIRVRGSLVPVEGQQRLTATDTREIVYAILNSSQRQRLETDWQIDFAYSIPGHARFRVNSYFQRGTIGAAFRLAPDVILVGEMRDMETIGTALTAAETGHLVFATLHTQDAPQTVDRII